MAPEAVLLTKGIIKAIFTTRPTNASKVIVHDDGEVEVKAADEAGSAHTASPHHAS